MKNSTLCFLAIGAYLVSNISYIVSISIVVGILTYI